MSHRDEMWVIPEQEKFLKNICPSSLREKSANCHLLHYRLQATGYRLKKLPTT